MPTAVGLASVMAKTPSTPALRWLRSAGIDHSVHPYDYVERGGTRASAAALGVEEHVVIKTLVFEDADGSPLVVLMHGDREVSAKALARALGTRSTAPCAPATAQRHSGYQVGGTSPFGLRKPLPVYVERTILDLESVYVNGGARGLLVRIDPRHFVQTLGATPVSVAR